MKSVNVIKTGVAPGIQGDAVNAIALLCCIQCTLRVVKSKSSVSYSLTSGAVASDDDWVDEPQAIEFSKLTQAEVIQVEPV